MFGSVVARIGEDVARIASSLTDRERAAVLGKVKWLTHKQALEWPMCGTVERMTGTHKWRATSLGLELRRHLLRTTENNNG